MFAIRPEPNTGVGMRKIRLLAARRWVNPGCVKLQPAPHQRGRLIVNMVSTPPFGLLRLAVPLALKKNGKRASRTGPVELMKDGMVLVEPLTVPLAITWLCGLGPMLGKTLALGLDPPGAGWEVASTA